MLNKYLTHILILLVTIIISVTFIFYFRYEVNVFNIGSNKQCMIRTNLFTGESCYVSGHFRCSGSLADLISEHEYNDIPYCVSKPN